MSSPARYEREPTSAPGDFYVENQCCTACGVPIMVAPDLIGYVDETRYHCRWKKQPETPEELNRAFQIFDGQELGCHRYAGHDPEIIKRLSPDCCDYPLPQQEFISAARDLCFLPLEAPSLIRRLWNKLRGAPQS